MGTQYNLTAETALENKYISDFVAVTVTLLVLCYNYYNFVGLFDLMLHVNALNGWKLVTVAILFLCYEMEVNKT